MAQQVTLTEGICPECNSRAELVNGVIQYHLVLKRFPRQLIKCKGSGMLAGKILTHTMTKLSRS